MYLSTQDRLQELFTSGHDSAVAIFPNASLVRRLCKNCQQDTFSIELVFACHASCDPNDLVIDLLGKFAVECKFFCDWPRGTEKGLSEPITQILAVGAFLWGCEAHH